MNGELMRSEMAEQPAVLARFADHFDEHVERVRELLPARLAGVTFVARGSSDHAAVYGRYLVELASGRPAALTAPSLQTLYGAHVDYDGWLVVALSQLRRGLGRVDHLGHRVGQRGQGAALKWDRAQRGRHRRNGDKL